MLAAELDSRARRLDGALRAVDVDLPIRIVLGFVLRIGPEGAFDLFALLRRLTLPCPSCSPLLSLPSPSLPALPHGQPRRRQSSFSATSFSAASFSGRRAYKLPDQACTSLASSHEVRDRGTQLVVLGCGAALSPDAGCAVAPEITM